MKNEKIVPLGTIAAFCYMFFVFFGGYNSETTKDIKLKFSTFLSSVEVNKCVNFQTPRLMGFKAGLFRISPIGSLQEHEMCLLSIHFVLFAADNV